MIGTQDTPDESGVAIETRTVQVRTLTVNNRKMSLTMYRQLIEEPIDDGDEAHLWGTVNYHEGNTCYDRYGPGEHYHVVWQSGGELRRSTVFPPYRGHPRQDAESDAAELLWLRIRALPQVFIG